MAEFMPEESRIPDIRRVLERRPVWLVLPVELQRPFQYWRLRDLDRYITVGTLPLMTLVFILSVVENFRLTSGVSHSDALLWRYGCLFVNFALGIALILAQFPRIQRHYAWVAVPASLLVMAKFVAWPQLITDRTVATSESFFCMIAATIIMLALRLSLLQATLVCAGGAVLGGLVALVYAPGPLNLHAFSYYYVALCGVCLFVGWLMEQSEKIGFLQALLVRHAAHERERLIEELDRMAHRDTLSGLANRREFDRRLALEWDRLRRERKPLAVLYIDIDHFKAFNDRYGHAAGDICLGAVGRAIGQALLRPADLAARYGGEEFVVLLPDTDEKGAGDVALRVLAQVDAMAIRHESSVTADRVTVSIGVAALSPDHGWQPGDLMEMADAGLYAAKSGGRHQVRAHHEPLKPPVVARAARP